MALPVISTPSSMSLIELVDISTLSENDADMVTESPKDWIVAPLLGDMEEMVGAVASTLNVQEALAVLPALSGTMRIMVWSP